MDHGSAGSCPEVPERGRLAGTGRHQLVVVAAGRTFLDEGAEPEEIIARVEDLLAD